AKAVEGSPQLFHARGALRGVGAEDLLIVDPPPSETRERLERRAGAPRVRDARHARSPGVAHAPLRRAGELVGGRGVLEGAERADPAGELALRVLVGEVRQLEVRVCVDETRDEAGVRKRELTGPRRRGHEAMGAYGGDSATIVNENGAVLDGRRGNRMHGPGTDAEHERLGVRGSGLGGCRRTPEPLTPSPESLG